MTDGFGRRITATDAATGEPIEQLELETELALHTGFGSALADRVTRLATVRHASFVRPLRIDRPAVDRLVVVSEATTGRRLSELLDAAEQAGRRPAVEAVVALVRQLLPAVALFSRHRKDHALGALAPERLWLVAPARVVIGDAALGAGIDHLALTRAEAWQRYRIAAPAADGPVRSHARGDVTALGVITLAMLHGRRLRADEFPDALPRLVSDARERHGDEEHPLSSVFAHWLRRALQLETHSFESPQAAQVAFEEVLASHRRYVTGTGALEAWAAELGGLPQAGGGATAAAATQPHEPAEGGTAPAVDQVTEPPLRPEPPAGAEGRWLGLRSRWALALLVVLLLQAAVIGWYWTRPAPGPAEGEGELVVTSRPTGARVIVDGTDRGETPLTLTLRAGAHVIEVRAGAGEPRVIPLVIRANVQTAQYVELQEAVPVPPPVERRASPRPKR